MVSLHPADHGSGLTAEIVRRKKRMQRSRLLGKGERTCVYLVMALQPGFETGGMNQSVGNSFLGKAPI